MHAREIGFLPTTTLSTSLLRSASAIAILLVAGGCAPVVKRDLSAMPVGHVGFEDLCGLQIYFDKLETKEGTAPTVVHSSEIEGKKARTGRTRFAFETEFQLQAVRRVLTENWQRLPPATADAPRVDIEVQWSQRGGLRRVVTDEDAELIVGPQRSSLPYHVCLSELLFGAPIYHQRRDVLGLAPLPLPRSMVLESDNDGGTREPSNQDGGTRDAGARDASNRETSNREARNREASNHDARARDAGAPDKR